MMRLTVEEILQLHARILAAFGGSPGLRDRGLLESAVYSADGSFGDTEAYPTITEKAARLAYAITKNHPFVDGNKRVGVMVMLLTLRLNAITLQYTQQELISLGLGIADNRLQYEDVFLWIKNHTL